MKELRKDYLLDRWVYYSTTRKKRPQEFKKKLKVCFFCPGNENLTPPEIGRVEEKGKWKLRWFPNKFSVVDEENNNVKRNDKKYFLSMHPYGKHEVIVETEDHNKQLFDLPPRQIYELLKVYCIRIKALSTLKNIKYVQIFKNHGKEAGTSLVHSHTQVVAIPKVPLEIKDKLDAVRKHKKCPYCDVIKKEKKSKRIAFENKTFVAFTPYASRFHYELWMFPKRHVKNITELNDKELMDLAKMMKKALFKLKKLGCSYNYYLHYAPKGKDLHFHIEIIPRMSTFAGFEYATGDIINSLSPEEAAAYYRK